MKTLTINLYTYDELTAEAQNNAIEQNREINVDYPSWDEFIIDEMKDALEKAGIEKPEIQYSGFWSQGDGLSFTARNVNLELLMTASKASEKYPEFYEALKEGLIDYSCWIERIDNFYVHGRTATLILDSIDNLADDEEDEEEYYRIQDVIDAQLYDLTEYLDQWREETASDFYHQLRKEYEYLTDDEAIIETIQANEYYFDQDGNIK